MNRMVKVVINRCTGGFSLSHKAFLRLREFGQAEALNEHDGGAYWPSAAGPEEPSLNTCGALVPRDDHKLVQVVEELGVAANGHCANLKIVEVPLDVKWGIESHHGLEQVKEVHRTWS